MSYSNQFPRKQDVEKLTINERANVLYFEMSKNAALMGYIRKSIEKDRTEFNRVAESLENNINKIIEVI